MEDIPNDSWSPYKQMYGALKDMQNNPNDGNKLKFHSCLKNLKPNFMNFLRNPPKNECKRAILQSSDVSSNIIQEAIILSDMFDLDELISLELLHSAQKQKNYYAGLPHGLVAILLYYDGRRALSWTLRDLFEITAGVSWSAELPKELIETISKFTQYLVEESNILERLIELLEEFDIYKEWELLSINLALSSKRQQYQVWNLLMDTKLAIATSLFNWSAQRGLPKAIQIHLIDLLLKYKTSLSNGNIDNIGLTLLMSVLYSFDTSVLLRHRNDSAYVEGLPILSDASLGKTIYQKLSNLTIPSVQSQCNHYANFMVFCFGLSLACLKYLPPNLQIHCSNIPTSIDNRDEILVGKAMKGMNIFDFMYHDLFENELLFMNQFFFRRMHDVFMDFLDYMHPQVKELRDLAVAEAPSVETFCKSLHLQSIPHTPFDNRYELLMLCIAKFYKGNPCNLSLCDEYWSLAPNPPKHLRRSSTIFLFIYNNGKRLPRRLFPSYVRMLVGLTSSELSAHYAFDLLKKAENPLDGRLNWDHFFKTIHYYYNNLRQDRGKACCGNCTPRLKISPYEMEALYAIMSLIRNVTLHDEASRIELTETINWSAIRLLVGLISCPVTVSLKAEILFTLNNLVHSKEIASQIWSCLEESQVIETIPMPKKETLNLNLNDEIKQNECCNKEYPLSRGILALLNTLLTTYMPADLSTKSHKRFIIPYLIFMVESIFLKFYNRIYNKETEKWEIGTECLKILHYLLKIYNPESEDLVEKQEIHSLPPGYHLMVELNIKSNILHTILILIGDACKILDDYSKFPGKEYVENCGLYCLLMLEEALLKQYAFFEIQTLSNNSELLIGLNRILLELNPITNQPDFILNIMKFVTYNSWLPRHTLAAIKILHSVVCLPNASEDIFNLCLRPPELNEILKLELRLGFAECFEATSGAYAENDESDLSDSTIDSTSDTTTTFSVKIRNIPRALQIKEAILQLFQRCIMQPMPNVGYFLLGYNVQHDIYGINPYRNIVVIDNGMNCMTALIATINKFLNTQKNNISSGDDIEYIAERCWYLFHNLFANHITAKTTMRHFRNNCNDILMRQLTALLTCNQETYSVHIVNQVTHVLKCITKELIMAAIDNEILRYEEILHILLSSIEIPNSLISDKPLEIVDYPSRKTSASLNEKEPIHCMRICVLLKFVTLDDNISIPIFNYFNNDKLSNIIKSCLEKDKETQLTLICTKKLSDALHKHISNTQIAIESDRHLILHELKRIMTLADQLNTQNIKQSRTANLMKAWNQLIQILFIFAPEGTMPLRFRKHYMIKILESLLRKLVQIHFNHKILSQGSESLLLLLTYIRLYSSDQLDCDFKNESVAPCLKKSTLPLQFLLKNVIYWIMVADMSEPVLCMNLFTIFLQCLNIAMDSENIIGSDLFFDIDQRDFIMKQLNPFGTKLIETIWFNANYGIEIVRILAISCLNLIVQFEPMPNLVDFFSKRGYIRQIVASLSDLDTSLMDCLAKVPKNTKEINVYESKMAFLMRYASSRDGAEILLAEKFLLALSKMKVFNMHPDIKESIRHPKITNVNDVNENNDEFVDHYHTIFMSTLNTLDRILTTFETENRFASTQIFNFQFVHKDFELVLRTATPHMRLNTLKELSLLTNIIARAAVVSPIEYCEENYLKQYTSYAIAYFNDLNKIKMSNDNNDCCIGDNNDGPNGGYSFFSGGWRNWFGLRNWRDPQIDGNNINNIATDIHYHIEDDTDNDGVEYYDDIGDYVYGDGDEDGGDDKESEDELKILTCDRIQQKHLERMQHLMFPLFERFAINETIIHDLLTPNEAIFDPTEGNKNLRIKYFLEIAMNMTLYCRNIITCRRRYNTITSLFDYDVQLMNGISSGPQKLTGVINILLNQVKGLVDFYLKLKPVVHYIHKHICALTHRLDNEEKERLGKLKKLYADKKQFQHNIVIIIEQNIYLIWLYLDYYFHPAASCVKCGNPRSADHGNKEIDNISEEIDAVKQILLDTFNSTFCDELLSTIENTNDTQDDVKVYVGLIMELIENDDINASSRE